MANTSTCLYCGVTVPRFGETPEHWTVCGGCLCLPVRDEAREVAAGMLAWGPERRQG